VEIKELIESGSLELYVMGSLPPDEMLEIDELRKTHPELNEEISRIEETMIAYADSHAVKPKDDLKEKIAGKLNFAVSLDLNEERVDSILIQMPGIYRYAAAAAVLLILFLGGTTFYYAHKYNETSNQLAALQSEKNQMAQEVKFVVSKSAKLQEELAVTSDPNNEKIALSGLPISPNSKAVVYWNNETGNTYINSSLLPQIAANEQFQLWAIVDGKPVDLGTIDKQLTFLQMKLVKNATLFAITLEPLGGSKAPTLERMYAAGKV
jgi:anti-sigma-K factor RskA